MCSCWGVVVDMWCASQVEVRQQGTFWDTTIARVLVPVPGLTSDVMSAPSFAPIDDWFHFAGDTPMRSTVFPSSKIAALKNASGANTTSWATHQRFTMGSVRVAVAWGGDFGVGVSGNHPRPPCLRGGMPWRAM